jgi:hypothetical protein
MAPGAVLAQGVWLREPYRRDLGSAALDPVGAAFCLLEGEMPPIA